MTSYGQFCPVAKAMEVLDERWTLLIVRELLLGSTHYNQLRRGVPKMSPSLLSTRLRSLERLGVITRRMDAGHSSYALTQAGMELAPLVQAISQWGQRWVGDLGDEDLDPHLLFWDMERSVALEKWPRSRTVVAFELTGVDAGTARWWLVVAGDHVEVCDFDPGYEVIATVVTSLRTLVRLWRGDIEWTSALVSGAMTVDASSEVRRQLPGWLRGGAMSPHPLAAAV